MTFFYKFSIDLQFVAENDEQAEERLVAILNALDYPPGPADWQTSWGYDTPKAVKW